MSLKMWLKQLIQNEVIKVSKWTTTTEKKLGRKKGIIEKAARGRSVCSERQQGNYLRAAHYLLPKKPHRFVTQSYDSNLCDIWNEYLPWWKKTQKNPQEIKPILDPSLPLKCYWSITINIIPLVLYYWVFKGRWITWDLFTRDEFKGQLLFIRAEIMCLECLSFYLTPAFFPAHNFLQKKIQ